MLIHKIYKINVFANFNHIRFTYQNRIFKSSQRFDFVIYKIAVHAYLH